MKKYWGKKEWDDTLYQDFNIEDDDFFDYDNFILTWGLLKPEDIFGRGVIDKNNFNDMNDFYETTENFNFYQSYKI